MDKGFERDIIKTLEGFIKGETIEFRVRGRDTWKVVPRPCWDWASFEYRVQPAVKPSINWDHVNPEFKCMATDLNGKTYLYQCVPVTGRTGRWVESQGLSCETLLFSSFKPGNCHWKDSLVKRP